MATPVSSTETIRVCICVCTFKRPEFLRRALNGIGELDLDSRIRVSIVVVDNDRNESPRNVVTEFQAKNALKVSYVVEPRQNIAQARNTALSNAQGDFIAFIDDDEFPSRTWLLSLVTECERAGVDGVLGPVRPHFDSPPPRWLVRGKFCERPEYETGTILAWRDTRTGNVLFRRRTIEGMAEPFNCIFANGGEDQDFFRRLMQKGCRFSWCNEAVVHEVVPPERWRRRYLLKRALLRGQNERHLLNWKSLVKSVVAVGIYTVILPLSLLLGHHRFMSCAIRLLDHGGKLIGFSGARPMGEQYLVTAPAPD